MISAKFILSSGSGSDGALLQTFLERSKHFGVAKSNGVRSSHPVFHPPVMAVSKALMFVSRHGQVPAKYLRATAISITLAILFSAAAPSFAADVAPDRSTVGTHGMVVSESKDAAGAGLEILKHGGNAVDAAVATALAVGVTNPASCGIGGGGFMLIYIADDQRVYALDYRERAPARAKPELYMRDGHPAEELLKTGPLAVAVPGEIAGI